MGYVILGIIIFAGIFVTTIVEEIKRNKDDKNNELKDYINFIKKNGMNTCKKVSFHNIVRVDIDIKNKLLGAYSYYEDESVLLKFDEVLDFEIIENGNSVVSSRTGSAVIGGLLFGGLGAVAGASGSREINKTCNTLKLKIYTSNIKNSVVILDFLEDTISKISPLYEQITDVINEMIGLLKIAREHNRQAERIEDKNVIVENAEDIKQNNKLSSLKELAELKENGIITQEEFEESKRKILSKL